MIVFGYRTKVLATFAAPDLTCGRCGGGREVLCIAQRYYHISWIIRFPGKKKAVVICADCKQNLDEEEMSPSLLEIVDAKKEEVKTPWHYYTGFAAIAIVIIAALVSGPKRQETPATGVAPAGAPTAALSGTHYFIARLKFSQTTAYRILKASMPRDSAEVRMGRTWYYTRDKAVAALRDHDVDSADYFGSVMPAASFANLARDGDVSEVTD